MSTPVAAYNIVSHPLLLAKLSELRRKETSPADFRRLIKEISTIIGVEASRDVQLTSVEGVSPVAPFTGYAIANRIGFSPILRAGITMTDSLLELFPDASVYYLGLYREKVSLQPVEYYQKLPSTPTIDTLYVLDPLVATGGTVIAAIEMLLDWGLKVNQIKLLTVLASKPGIEKVAKQYPGLDIYVGAVDDVLTNEGYIYPGLGDAGDRAYKSI